MKIFLTVLLLFFVLATVFSMLRGMQQMGCSGGGEKSNHFMAKRLWFQAFAFGVLAILLWIKE
jgi:polyferredoxin